MNKTILVTGPDLDPAAQNLVEARGYKTIHTPAYADSNVISETLESTGAVGVVSRMGRLNADVINKAVNLKVISKHGVGTDNIDLEAAAKRNIPVLVATGANAVSVAEHAISLLLATVKRIRTLDAGLREGRWEKPGFSGVELDGSTMGLLGMGSIAQATGRMAKGLGLKLIGYDPFADEDVFAKNGVERCDNIEDLFAGSDILSLHCPLNEQTKNIINASAIAKMPPGGFIVNTARGGLIDEAALVEAVRSGHLAGAGLDTFAVEPPAADHPFFAESNIIITPHIGGVTRQAGARVGVAAVEGIMDLLEGKSIPPERIANRKLLNALSQ
ncbi:MAG: hydroxyacid dehydrogenase [Methylocystaceae bacterium]|nr:hydroxyacid dehydrogenase [Methylocystaceae bacterium]